MTDLATEITDFNALMKYNQSESHINTWADRLKAKGVINEETLTQIKENTNLKGQIDQSMSDMGLKVWQFKGKKDIRKALTDLYSRRQELQKNPKVNKKEIKELSEQIDNIVREKQVTPEAKELLGISEKTKKVEAELAGKEVGRMDAPFEQLSEEKQIERIGAFKTQVENVKKALGSMVEDTKFEVAESTKDFQKMLTDDNLEIIEGEAAAVVFVKETGKFSHILIDGSKANEKTIMHEAMHVVLQKTFGNDQAKFKEFQSEISDTLTKQGYGSLAKKMEAFANQKEYAGVQGEEFLVELSAALVSEGFDVKKLSGKQKTTLQQVAQVINKMVQTITGSDIQVFTEDASPESILEFLAETSTRLQKGEDVTKKVISKREQRIKEQAKKRAEKAERKKEKPVIAKARKVAKKKAAETRAKIKGIDKAKKEFGKTGRQLELPLRRSQLPLAVRESVGSMPEAIKFANQQEMANQLEFKTALDARFLEDIDRLREEYGSSLTPGVMNKAMDDYLADAFTNETLLALETEAGKEAVGWYDEKTKNAMAIMGLIHPELNTEEGKRGMFTLATAITSNGNKVNDNFKEADRQYRYYQENGRFDSKQAIGTQGAGIKKSFEFLNKILDEGVSEMQLVDFLTSPVRVGDLSYGKVEKGKKKKVGLISGYTVDENVFGAAIFGPKIGNGFFMNLQGMFENLTIDRWFMRQYGRLTGQLRAPSKDLIKKNKAKIASLLRSLSASERKVLREQVGKYKLSDIEGFVANVARKSAKLKVREALAAESETLDQLRAAANSMNKNIRAEVEAPSAATRKFIEKVFEKARQNINKNRKLEDQINTADMQAINWYPEKALYQAFKKDQDLSKAEKEMMEQEQPDYESAAKTLAKENKIDESQINKAIKDSKSKRGESARETEPTTTKRSSQERGKDGKEEVSKKVIAAKQTQTRRSQIGDEVVYHGGPIKGLKGLKRGYSGAIFFTPDKTYASSYGKGTGQIYQATITKEKKEKLFDIRNPKHIQKLKEGFLTPNEDLEIEYESEQDALRDYKNAVASMTKDKSESGLLDWSIGGQWQEQMENAGFEGAQFQERPSMRDDKGIMRKPIISYALFDKDILVEDSGIDPVTYEQKPTRRSQIEDYRGTHTSPRPEEGVKNRADDMTDVYPDDIYGPMGERYYGERRAYDKKALKVIREMRDNPEMEVTIYRSVPSGVSTINPGDWVTITEEYAKEHGMDADDASKDWPVISMTVKAKELFTDGNSIQEWGYHPAGAERRSQIGDKRQVETDLNLRNKDGSLKRYLRTDRGYREALAKAQETNKKLREEDSPYKAAITKVSGEKGDKRDYYAINLQPRQERRSQITGQPLFGDPIDQAAVEAASKVYTEQTKKLNKTIEAAEKVLKRAGAQQQQGGLFGKSKTVGKKAPTKKQIKNAKERLRKAKKDLKEGLPYREAEMELDKVMFEEYSKKATPAERTVPQKTLDELYKDLQLKLFKGRTPRWIKLGGYLGGMLGQKTFNKIMGEDGKKTDTYQNLKYTLRKMAQSARLAAKNTMQQTRAIYKASRALEKRLRKELNDTLRAMMKDTPSLTANVVKAIMNKYRSTNIFSEESRNKFVDYLEKIVKNAKLRENIDQAYKDIKQIKANIKSAKYGSDLTLISDIKRLISLSPSLIPLDKPNVFQEYMDVLSELGQKGKVIGQNLSQAADLKSRIEMLLKEVYEQEFLLIDLSNRYYQFVGNTANVVNQKATTKGAMILQSQFVKGQKTFAQILNDMVSQDIITESERDLMMANKDMILSKEPSTAKTAEERQLEHDDAVVDVLNALDDVEETISDEPGFFNRFVAGLEREVAKKFVKLVKENKTGVIQDFTTAELKHIAQTLRALLNGYVTNVTQSMVESIVGKKSAKEVTAVLNKAELRPFEKYVGIVKAFINKLPTGRDNATMWSEAIRRNPLAYIDQTLGLTMGRTVFKNLLEPIARGYSVYQNAKGKLDTKLKAAQQKLSKAYNYNSEKIVKAKFRIQAALIQQEFVSNPNNLEVAPAIDFLKATLDQAKSTQKNEYSSKKNQEAIQEIIDKVSKGKTPEEQLSILMGELDAPAKEAMKEISNVYKSMTNEYVYTATIIRGEEARPRKDYVHIQVISDEKLGMGGTAKSVMDEFMGPRGGTTKSGLIHKRTPGAKPIRLDPFVSAGNAVTQTMLDYHVTIPMRTVSKATNSMVSDLDRLGKRHSDLKELIPAKKKELANTQNPVQQKALQSEIASLEKELDGIDLKKLDKEKNVADAIRMAIRDVQNNILENDLTELTFIDVIGEELAKAGYVSLLASPDRMVAEYASNVSAAVIGFKSQWAEGGKYTDVYSNPQTGSNVMSNLKSTQIEKSFPANEFGGAMTEKILDTSDFGPGRITTGMVDRFNDIYNRMGITMPASIPLIGGKRMGLRETREFTMQLGDWMIATPDQVVTRRVWFGAFAQKFEQEIKAELATYENRQLTPEEKKRKDRTRGSVKRWS